MRNNMPLVALITVVVIVIVGYFGLTSFNDKKVLPKPKSRDVKVSPLEVDNISLSSSGAGEKISIKSAVVTDVPGVDIKAGEQLVWGEVKAVDQDRRVLTIDQEMDDNSVQISPNIPVSKEAIIRTRQENITLAKIKPGDMVGIIINKAGQARAVLVNY